MKRCKLLQDHGVAMISVYAAAKSRAEWEKYFNIGSKLYLKFLLEQPESRGPDFIDRLAGEYKMRLAVHDRAKNESKYRELSYLLCILKGRRNIKDCVDMEHWARRRLAPVENLHNLRGNILSIPTKNILGAGNGEKSWTNLNEGIVDCSLVAKELQRQNFRGSLYIDDERNVEDNFTAVGLVLNNY